MLSLQLVSFILCNVDKNNNVSYIVVAMQQCKLHCFCNNNVTLLCSVEFPSSLGSSMTGFLGTNMVPNMVAQFTLTHDVIQRMKEK